MDVRFILGRAGSGKTHYCLESIRNHLRENAVDGPKLIFLVPEQASHQMERAILLPQGGGEPILASHRAEVFSFRRLADRLLESTTANLPDPLSDSARTMVLRHVAAELAPRLKYYRRVLRHPGFLERLAATISELIQEGASPDELDRAPMHGSSEDAGSAAKCHDLALLYRAYLGFLGGRLVDPSQSLRLARERISNCAWIHESLVWVDGFASLGGEEAATLGELVRHARRCEIAVLLDSSMARSGTVPPPGRTMFARTARTYGELHDLLVQAGCTIEDPLLLDSSCAPRFIHAPQLQAIERSLFGPPPMAAQVEPASPLTQTQSVTVAELSSRRMEVEHAVSLICQWTRCDQPQCRYRDIALIVRDLDPYYDLVRRAFEDRAIACFIDRRRQASHHPLIELLRTGARLAVDGWTSKLMRILLKTGLLPLSADDADELENYFVAHGVQGLEAWRGPDWNHKRIGEKKDSRRNKSQWELDVAVRVNDARRRVTSALSGWADFAGTATGHTGVEWSEGLRAWLSHLNAGATLAKWVSQSQSEGDLDQAGEHEQIASEVAEFIDALNIAFEQRHLSKEEFAEVVEAGLSSICLGLVPPTVDQVLVGSIERTRHPDIKVAILLGFNEGIFPARPEEDTMLNDDDRVRLLAAGIRVGLPARQRLHDEAMLAYIALTRASQKLVITYARADDQGTKLRPSSFLKELKAACPDVAVTVVSDPEIHREMWDIQTMADLRRRLTTEFRSRPAIQNDRSPFRAEWNKLYEQARPQLSEEFASGMALSSLGNTMPIVLNPRTMARLYPGHFQTSVSSLESYAACPFKFFSEKILGLRERAESELAAMDVGTIHHTILEELALDLVSRNQGLAHLSGEEIIAALRASCGRAAARLQEGAVACNARDAYMLRRAAGRLGRVLRAQQRATAPDGLRPKAAELSFGMEDGKGLPALKLKTPGGRDVSLRGMIDRVDLIELADEFLGVVIDYKNTRDKKLDFSQSYHGISLQLLAYLLVLADHGVTLAGRPIRPGGALYVSLGLQYHKVSHPSQDTSRVTAQEGTFRPRGLLNADLLDRLKVAFGPNGWVPSLAVHRKQDGDLGYVDRNDAAPPESFQAMLEHTRRRMAELAGRLLEGDMEIHPVRLGAFNSCSWCKMAMVCRFESDLCEIQYLPSYKRKEVYDLLSVLPAAGVTKE